jgi:hypothetical protein
MTVWVDVHGLVPFGVTGAMNGLRRPMLSLIEHLQWPKERVPVCVPAAVVQTGVDKQRRSWVNIFAWMDLWQTIPGGGEADPMRDEIVRQRIEDDDDDDGGGETCQMTTMKHTSMKDVGRWSQRQRKGVLWHVVCGTATPSRAYQGFSTGCHCASNGREVPVYSESRCLRCYVDSFWQPVSERSHSA